MKIFKNLLKAISVAVFALVAVSCNNDDNGIVEKYPTIAEILKNDAANFSILEKALLKTDLLNTFRNPGSYTVFAPTNAAFNTIGVNDAFIDALVVNSPAFKDFKRRLQYHVLALNLNGQYSTELPAAGYMNTYSGYGSTTNPMSLYINQTSGIVLNGGTINGGAVVTTGNVPASNGVVHVINAVLELPTIAGFVKCNPDLTTLLAIVTSAPQSAVLTDLVSVTGPITDASPTTAVTQNRTLFAPTNTAFSAATWIPASTAPGYDAAVTKVLKYHLLNNNTRAASATAFASATAATTLTTQVVGPVQTLSNPANSLRLVDSTTTNATLTLTNIQAKNGVIHIVSKVLQPL